MDAVIPWDDIWTVVWRGTLAGYAFVWGLIWLGVING
jgi:hypothetical protein